jgi:glutamate-1-semialdehyde 2,1-aminomutase
MLQDSVPPAMPSGPGPRSLDLHERAGHVFPEGVTRATIERDPSPIYVQRGDGAYLVDVDGRRFLDTNLNFTTLINGHGFAPVCEAVEKLLRDGTCFANPTQHEIALAELLCDRIPRVERIRFVNTGTEAVMFAIKAARATTGRPAIAKLEGAYHGGYDWAEVGQAGTPATWGSAEDPVAVSHYHGQPPSVTNEVVLLRLNDAEGARRRIAANADRLACILIDPCPSRAGLIGPEPAFVTAITETARRHGILIVSDEVLNLRQGYHGCSARYGLTPDLVAMGKIIGGGFPIGAIGGTVEAMRVFESGGGRTRLPQGGTFSANPVSMVAGLAGMRALTPEIFDRLDALGQRLRRQLDAAIAKHGAPFSVTGAASLFRIHPRPTPPREFREAYTAPTETATMKALARFFRANGVILRAAAAACLSTPMTETDIDLIADIFDRFLAEGGQE